MDQTVEVDLADMEYNKTEIKMLEVGVALLISKPKIKFTVPIKVTQYSRVFGETP